MLEKGVRLWVLQARKMIMSRIHRLLRKVYFFVRPRKTRDQHFEILKIDCVYCKREHASHKCSIVSDPKARLALLRKESRCFVCLRIGHRSVHCKINYFCVKCKGRHNLSICDNNDSNRSQEYGGNVTETITQHVHHANGNNKDQGRI